MNEIIQVVTTVDSREKAQDISRCLLEEKLAACVQVSGPITSSYWWKGELESSREWSCTVKTTVGMYTRVEKTIREIHPYDEPEILAMPVVFGSQGYLDWVKSSLKDAE